MKSALEQCPLPPLPHPWSPLQIEESMYTADQMRDYARAAIAAADDALVAPQWVCKAGGLKPLTDEQYQAQPERIQRHYSRAASALPEAPSDDWRRVLVYPQALPAAQPVAFSAGMCNQCGKWAGAHATLPGQPRDHLCVCAAPAPQAAPQSLTDEQIDRLDTQAIHGGPDSQYAFRFARRH